MDSLVWIFNEPYAQEPFVLASQVKQIFYVQNSNDTKWHTIVEIQTRGVYDMN